MKIALLTALFVCGISSALPPENRQPPGTENKAHVKVEKSKAEVASPLPIIQIRNEVSGSMGEQVATKEDRNPDEVFAWRATAVSAFIAALALVVAGLQVWLFRDQLGKMDKALQDGKIMADAAKTSADAALKSAQLAYKQLVATHRPRLILRDAYCESNEIGDQITVTYVIVNAGGTPASIIASTIEVKLITGTDWGAHPRIPVQLGKNEIGEVSIRAGEGIERIHTSGRQWRSDDDSRHAFDEPHLGVFFCGHLTYVDNDNVVRHTMFWRKYSLNDSRFYKQNMPMSDALDNAD